MMSGVCLYFRRSHHDIAIFFLDFRVFLLRDSQSNPKTFVLSLCHMQRIKHFQIVPVSFPFMLHHSSIDWFSWPTLSSCLQMDDEGEVLLSLDDGHTRFTDLIQLVEFYQLNCGVLPCKLKHHCTRITLWARGHQIPVTLSICVSNNANRQNTTTTWLKPLVKKRNKWNKTKPNPKP